MLRLKYLKAGDLIYLEPKENFFRISIKIDGNDNTKYYSLVRVISKNNIKEEGLLENSVFTVLNDQKKCISITTSYNKTYKRAYLKYSCLYDNKIVYISDSFLKSYFKKIKGKK